MIEPMKCSTITELPANTDGLIMETKYDGWRGFLVVAADGSVSPFSATWKPIGTIPYICKAASNFPANTILDGEIVNLDGTAQWNKAQSICSRDEVHIPDLSANPPDAALTFMAFDVLEVMGKRVLDKPLSARKELLDTVLRFTNDEVKAELGDVIRPVESLPIDESAFALLIDEGYEGVVLKRTDSFYSPGQRGPQWTKLKAETEVEVEITGIYAAEAGSKYEHTHVGGFTFHVVHADGLEFDGRCGTGMTDALRRELHEDPNAFIGRVAELKHWGIGDSGALRFPSLKRIRDAADKAVPENVEPVDLNAAYNANGQLNIADLQTLAGQPLAPNVDVLLTQLIEVTIERDTWKAKAENLQLRLDGAVRGVVESPPTRTPSGRTRRRNFKAMDAPKLTAALRDLTAGHGPAYETAISRGEDPDEALRRATAAAREKGLTV